MSCDRLTVSCCNPPLPRPLTMTVISGARAAHAALQVSVEMPGTAFKDVSLDVQGEQFLVRAPHYKLALHLQHAVDDKQVSASRLVILSLQSDAARREAPSGTATRARSTCLCQSSGARCTRVVVEGGSKFSHLPPPRHQAERLLPPEHGPQPFDVRAAGACSPVKHGCNFLDEVRACVRWVAVSRTHI